MTLDKVLSQMGMGVKNVADRFGEYGSASHEPSHVYYAYGSHGQKSSKHYSSEGHKGKAALSALTLLAFLFFLNILQQCINEQMQNMNPPQYMIMSSGKENDDENIAKHNDVNKIDKTGLLINDATEPTVQQISLIKNEISKHNSEEFPDSILTKVETVENPNHLSHNNYKIYNNYTYAYKGYE